MSNFKRLAKEFLERNKGILPCRNTPTQELSEEEYLKTLRTIESLKKRNYPYTNEQKKLVIRFYLMDTNNLPKWFKKLFLRKNIKDIPDFLQIPCLRIIKEIADLGK